MIRLARQTLTIALFAVASLAALAPSAHASTVITGTIDGAEVFPEAVEVLRLAARWRQEAAWHWDRAQRVGDGRTMAEIRRNLAIVDRNEQQARATLGTATTVVSVYGDAGTRVTRQQIIGLLRADGNHRYRHIHIWQRAGRVAWDTRAPKGGFDDRRGGPAPRRGSRPGTGTSGSTSHAGGSGAGPSAVAASRPSSRPRSGGGTRDRHAGALFGTGGLGNIR